MLRRTEVGLERDDFLMRTGDTIDSLAGPAIKRFTARRVSRRQRTAPRLSRDGLFVADQVLCEFLSSLRIRGGSRPAGRLMRIQQHAMTVTGLIANRNRILIRGAGVHFGSAASP